MDYDIAQIRELLTAAFTADELRRFCHDRPDFRPVCDNFGSGMGKSRIVDELVEYCETRLLFGELLDAVREFNPRRYAQFFGGEGGGGGSEGSRGEQGGVHQNISVGGSVGGGITQAGGDVNIHYHGTTDQGHPSTSSAEGIRKRLELLEGRANALHRDIGLEMDRERKFTLQERLREIEEEIAKLRGQL